MTQTPRVFLARLAGMGVFDPQAEAVGRVRDIVVSFSAGRSAPRVIGLVIEVPGRRRVFLPMTRVLRIDARQVIMTGLVNVRAYQQRPTEALALAELLDRQVTVTPPEGVPYPAVVEDVAMDQVRAREWELSKVFARKADGTGRSLSRLGRRRRGETVTVDIRQVTGLRDAAGEQGAQRFLEAHGDTRPTDLAEVLHDLPALRRSEIAEALDDERLADVLEELPEDDQVEILTHLDTSRAADILEAMEPDDAADLLSELPEEKAEELLDLMEPDDAADLRRLLSYDEDTAGGVMTTEPIVLAPETTIAEALAQVRQEEVSPAVATVVYVARPPVETPTGKLVGVVHIQRLLREPPHAAVGSIVDKEYEALPPESSLAEVTHAMAAYNQLSLPVVDDQNRLLGAVTVDDVLDHMLPDDWRERGPRG